MKSELKTNSLTLDGQIGVNYYFSKADTAEIDHAVCTVKGVATQVTPKVVTRDGWGECYKVTVPVAAKEMTEVISVMLVDENGCTSAPYVYSVICAGSQEHGL